MGELAAIDGGRRAGSALAIRQDQQSFSREQVDALRKMNGWEEVPSAELSVFFHQAQRTGLDPFARQIYLIGRYSRRNNRTDYTIQTSIDGMRLVADRTGRYAGSDRPRFGEEDGDKYAEVTVYKMVAGQRVPFTGVAYEVEFRQDRSPMWTKMPRTMLAKCAEAQALRKAFPADLSGIYGSEEMDQAGPTVSASEESDAAEAVEEAEVVDEGPRIHPEHQRVLDELAALEARIPPQHRPDHAQIWRYAEAKYGNATQAVQRLEGVIASLAEEANNSEDEPPFDPGLDPEPPLDEEPSVDVEEMRGAARQADPNGKAHKSQVDYLRSLCHELAGEEGVRRLEGRVGKPLEEFTQQEADRWIDEYSPRNA